MHTVEKVLAFFSAGIILAVAAVAVAAVVVDSEQGAVQRYCIDTPGQNVLGVVAVNTNVREMSWDIQYDALGTITALKVMGPVVPGSTTSATMAVALCGPPSLIGCMATVTTRQVTGTITQTSPAGLSLKTVIAAIRLEPWRYYLQIDTSTSSAEATAFFTQSCGAA